MPAYLCPWRPAGPSRQGQKLQTVSRASASSAVDRAGANTCAQVAHYQRASLRGSQLSWNAFKLSHSLPLSLLSAFQAVVPALSLCSSQNLGHASTLARATDTQVLSTMLHCGDSRQRTSSARPARLRHCGAGYVLLPRFVCLVSPRIRSTEFVRTTQMSTDG